MQTGNQTAAHVLDSSRAGQKVEVVLEDGSGQAVLRLSTWAEGLGWCAQKTIRLEAGQLDELQRAVTAARHRLARRRADEGQPIAPAQIIQFPTIA